ncbi:hypothetical protein [Methylobacterium nigriterrae]|uniref:hypothetical protein n=1 Tax=Methylobacterium nigriterrae TaxID=3127512 RepID=UPI0030140B7C
MAKAAVMMEATVMTEAAPETAAASTKPTAVAAKSAATETTPCGCFGCTKSGGTERQSRCHHPN